MKVFRHKSEVDKEIMALKEANKTIGLVPTMGALHEGHLSLVANGLTNNDIVFVKIVSNNKHSLYLSLRYPARILWPGRKL